jgi:hypothetical protein
MKTLDMADRYDPLSYQDEEPTIKIDMNAVLPKINMDDEDDEPTLPSMRRPVFAEEKRYPGVGLLLCLSTGLLFWGTVAYFIFR